MAVEREPVLSRDRSDEAYRRERGRERDICIQMKESGALASFDRISRLHRDSLLQSRGT